jgi:predicted house-cleaning noncanonical NTP pyrophosphatase (MazG superfamily)
VKEKYYHQKLVRDLIPEIITKDGEEYETRVLSEAEFEVELKKKLAEEAQELAGTPEEKLPNELADVLELVKSIATHYKIPFIEIEKLQEEKREKRGGFAKRLFLVWSTKKAGK